MADVIWLDQTLRGLAHGLHDGESVASRLPDVVAALRNNPTSEEFVANLPDLTPTNRLAFSL